MYGYMALTNKMLFIYSYIYRERAWSFLVCNCPSVVTTTYIMMAVNDVSAYDAARWAFLLVLYNVSGKCTDHPIVF